MFFISKRYQQLSFGPQRLAKSLVAVILVLMMLPLSGCGLLGVVFGGGGNNEKNSGTTPKPPLKLKKVALAMGSTVNDNWPVTVELVRVKDADLAKELLTMDAKQWFAEDGKAFRGAHPDAYFDRWEVVPGTSVRSSKVKKASGKVAGVLFCDLVHSQPPQRVTRNGRITIRIESDGCAITADR